MKSQVAKRSFYIHFSLNNSIDKFTIEKWYIVIYMYTNCSKQIVLRRI